MSLRARPTLLWTTVGACVIGLALVPTSAATALPATDLGVYRGAANPEAVAAFGRWLGRDPTWALDFLPADSWQTISRPEWFARRWADSPYRVVYSVPLLPSSGDATLAEGATGAYDGYFRRLARGLVDAGDGDAVIRLGWEMNGDWFRWSAAGHETEFVDYWRHVVDAMRSVEGAHFAFDWCPTAGPASMSASDAYPGDAYVDLIGLDVYDVGDPNLTPAQRWNALVAEPYGLDWQAGFAIEHAKPMTFPEWGLWLSSDGRGGGDDPYFVEQMWRWTASHDVAYEMYFDQDASETHELTDPRLGDAARRYRALFGPLPAGPLQRAV